MFISVDGLLLVHWNVELMKEEEYSFQVIWKEVFSCLLHIFFPQSLGTVYIYIHLA